jgi:transposase
MARIYKKHGSKFKAKVALEAIKEKKTLGELGQAYSIAPTQISTWKKHLEETSSTLFEGKNEKNHQEEIDRLHGVIGRITAERDFLERALSR